jgi:G:T/U-mismatch repair DNA glycosylase/ADP-ribose pyrophosphatase YjhB (NUDIX family)
VRAPDFESAVPDVLAPNLRIVFCGINPGRVSAAAHAHFANPRNDFWRLLHAAKLTPRVLEPGDQLEALEHGIGITNAAPRTTPGSSDLRRADFAGARERLERIAEELRPAWIGFVGKEAYRGVFAERAEHGVQERTLADTRLFVLPSTSPANAAVPWDERRRWFDELAGRASGLPLRDAVRAVVLDPSDRVLLVRFVFPEELWATPGGGVEAGEPDEPALRRELAEECGLHTFRLGPQLWFRTHWRISERRRYSGQTDRFFLVRAPAFEPSPELSAEQLRAEGVDGMRWWTPAELAASSELFAPRRLPALVAGLLRDGPPDTAVDVGV